MGGAEGWRKGEEGGGGRLVGDVAVADFEVIAPKLPAMPLQRCRLQRKLCWASAFVAGLGRLRPRGSKGYGSGGLLEGESAGNVLHAPCLELSLFQGGGDALIQARLLWLGSFLQQQDNLLRSAEDVAHASCLAK